MDSEEKYPEIRSKLQNLEQVKAGDDFVNKLHMKIVESEAEKRHEHEARFDEPRGGFLKNLFGNMQYPWLAPAVGFTVLIFFVFYITYLNKTASEKDQQGLTSQKQENTSQQNSDAGKNPTTQTPPGVSTGEDKTLTEKEKRTEKDIASDLKTERRENESSLPETQKRFSDKEPYKTESPKPTEENDVTKPVETESKAPSFSIDKLETKAKKEVTKENPDGLDQSGVLSFKKSDSIADSPGDSERITRGKIKEDEETKKLNDKMKINRSGLEKLRDEVVK
ncbi:MAG: hypothetical protein ABI462_01765 [Ignavibacteria bacterium]